MLADDALELRPARQADDAAIRELVGAVMGWGGDAEAARMWRWKHLDNPAGRSPTWVATHGEQVVAVRTFMRWQFDSDQGPRTAVRAVDTVTHRDYRGRGLFRTLTLRALDELASQGVDFVFNTPNDQSRPGYLSMGWRPVSRLQVVVRPRGLAGAVAMARNRVPAELDSLQTTLGSDARDGLDAAAADVLARSSAEGLRTSRTLPHLRWRYAEMPSLRYRVLTLGADPQEGVAVLRLRRRGRSREAAMVEMAAPSRRARSRLLANVVRGTGASYALGLAGMGGGLTVPRLGPLLVARPIASEPPPAGVWRLSLGDVELF